jgi:hypothetical protein
MALFDTIAAAEAAGSMIEIEKTASPPVRFVIINGPIVQTWTMTLITARREYVALTKAAAEAAVTANSQTGAEPGETFTWSYAETNRPAKAYKVIRLSELRTYAQV